MNIFEKKLADEIKVLTKGRLKDFTPSLQIGVIYRGKKIGEVKLGESRTYFDFASLTKIIFTVSTLMQLVAKKKINLKDKVQKHWPEFPFADVRIQDLLTHSAGFTAWAPFYKTLRDLPAKTRREHLKKMLFRLGQDKKRQSVYSDIDFLYLGFLLESITGKDLLKVWQNTQKAWPKNHLHFSSNNHRKYSKPSYAPTEKCPWRKKTLQGEVHDDNTYSLGGVSTHAGLFGTLDDLMMYGQMLRDGYKSKKGSRLGSQKILKQFLKRGVKPTVGDWAMGFMMPSKKGSTAGKFFSSQSVGHTGFTGTSLWFDPKRDLVVAILSNRVHPSRRRLKFRALRPLLHDAVVKCL